MLLVACFLLAVLSVPVFGGRLEELGQHRFARPWALAAALAVQILIVSIVPEADAALLAGSHVLSYGLAFVFLYANRDVPGLWLVGLGTAMNLTAIAANRGVMPATRSALATAGIPIEGGHFVNSGILADPKLIFLGDVFAVPEPIPLANVFSAGDVCVAIGAALILHQLCRSRLAGGRKNEPSIVPLKPLWDQDSDKASGHAH